ncbi:MAG: hypothetical protein O2822_00080 [Chloroflexi bacterium]|nr:hypothetical protein [Chloroflexota bacterium]
MVERNAARLRSFLAETHEERTRDAIQISSGGDFGIVVLVTPEAFEIRLPTTEWAGGAYEPTESSRLWRRVSAARVDDGALGDLISKARAARIAEFKRCRYCGETFPPERRHSVNVCDGCAEAHLGVVH